MRKKILFYVLLLFIFICSIVALCISIPILLDFIETWGAEFKNVPATQKGLIRYSILLIATIIPLVSSLVMSIVLLKNDILDIKFSFSELKKENEEKAKTSKQKQIEKLQQELDELN